MIEKIALEKQIPLVDIRRGFLMSGNVKGLLCEDGTHPNTSGQKVITSCFNEFANLLYNKSRNPRISTRLDIID